MQIRAGKFRVNQLQPDATTTGEEGTGYTGALATAGEQDLLIPGQGIQLAYESGHGRSGWTSEAAQLFQPGQVVTVIFTDET